MHMQKYLKADSSCPVRHDTVQIDPISNMAETLVSASVLIAGVFRLLNYPPDMSSFVTMRTHAFPSVRI